MTNNLPFCPQLPVAGRFSDLPEAHYFASLAVNSSLLKLVGRSPAHCKAAMDADEKTDTEAQRLGRMIHCAALEPDRFGEAYCQAPATEDFPEALTDLPSYKEKARELGLKVGGSKAELKARILDATDDTVFWEDLLPTLVGERSPLKSEHWHMAQSILTSIAASPRTPGLAP